MILFDNKKTWCKASKMRGHICGMFGFDFGENNNEMFRNSGHRAYRACLPTIKMTHFLNCIFEFLLAFICSFLPSFHSSFPISFLLPSFLPSLLPSYCSSIHPSTHQSIKPASQPAIQPAIQSARPQHRVPPVSAHQWLDFNFIECDCRFCSISISLEFTFATNSTISLVLSSRHLQNATTPCWVKLWPILASFVNIHAWN